MTACARRRIQDQRPTKQLCGVEEGGGGERCSESFFWRRRRPCERSAGGCRVGIKECRRKPKRSKFGGWGWRSWKKKKRAALSEGDDSGWKPHLARFMRPFFLIGEQTLTANQCWGVSSGGCMGSSVRLHSPVLAAVTDRAPLQIVCSEALKNNVFERSVGTRGRVCVVLRSLCVELGQDMDEIYPPDG